MDSPGAKTHEIVREIDECIQQSQGEYGEVYSRNVSSSNHGNDDGNFDFFKRDRKKVMRFFCKTLKEMQLTSGSSSPDTSCTLVQVRKDFKFEKYPENPRGKWDELAKQVTDVSLVQKL